MYHHPDCRRAPVPIHLSKTISRFLLADILKQIEVDEDTFLKSVRRR